MWAVIWWILVCIAILALNNLQSSDVTVEWYVDFYLDIFGQSTGRLNGTGTLCPNRVTTLEKAIKEFADNSTENVIVPMMGTNFQIL